jgi:hypothetical protein
MPYRKPGAPPGPPPAKDGGSTFVVNFGPGTVVGAAALGPGARAEGSVSVGAPAAPVATRFRATIDIRGATSRRNMASMLRDMAQRIGDGEDLGAVGSVTGDLPQGYAWNVTADQ